MLRDLLTVHQGERAQAGEGRYVYLCGVQGAGELHDRVQPVAEALLALEAVEHEAVAEHQLWGVGTQPGKGKKVDQFVDTSSLTKAAAAEARETTATRGSTITADVARLTGT